MKELAVAAIAAIAAVEVEDTAAAGQNLRCCVPILRWKPRVLE